MKIMFQLDAADPEKTRDLTVDRESAPAMGDTIVTDDERYIVTRIVHMLDNEGDGPAMIIAATSR